MLCYRVCAIHICRTYISHCRLANYIWLCECLNSLSTSYQKFTCDQRSTLLCVRCNQTNIPVTKIGRPGVYSLESFFKVYTSYCIAGGWQLIRLRECLNGLSTNILTSYVHAVIILWSFDIKVNGTAQ